MNYKINKVWVVVVNNLDGQNVYTFATRYVAMQAFNKIIKLLNKTFPDDFAFTHNINGTRGNAYYGLLDNHCTVTLTGSHLSYYTTMEEFETKKLIEGE